MSSPWLKCSSAAIAALFVSSCGGGGGGAVKTVETDTTAPVISFEGISAGQFIEANTTVTVRATDPSGVARLRLYLEGEEIAVVEGALISWLWGIGDSEPGPYTFTATVTDTLGNGGTSSMSVVLGSPPAPPAPPDPDPPSPPAGPDPPPQGPKLIPGVDYDAIPEPLDDDIFPVLKNGPPDFLDPEDKDFPKPLIFGISSGETISDGRLINIIALDDRGVEAICARVGDNQQWYAEGARLDIRWDTTRQPDGPCFFNIYMLDRGLHISRTEIKVYLLNEPDHEGPEIETDLPHGGSHYGPVEFTVNAKDPAGVRKITLYRNSGSVHKPELSYLAEAQGDELEYVYDPSPLSEDFPHVYSTLRIVAEDKLGITSFKELGVGAYYGKRWEFFPSSARGREKIGSPFKIEAERVIDRGLPSESAARVFTGEYEQVPGVYNGISSLMMEDPDGQILGHFPAGLYHFRLSADDYVYEWDEAFALPEEEELMEDPIDWELRFDYSAGLPGMRWQSEERTEGLMSCAGLDAKLLTQTFFHSDELKEYSSSRWMLYNEAVLAHARWMFIGHSAPDENAALDDPVVVENLRSWVRDGGLLIVSGTSYDFVEQLWPERIAFVGPGAEDGLSPTPQPVDASKFLWPEDIGLAWGTGASTIGYFGQRVNAAMMLPQIKAVDARVHVVEQAAVSPESERLPSMVTFAHGLGRVVYSTLPFNLEPAASAGPEQQDFLEYRSEVLRYTRDGVWR